MTLLPKHGRPFVDGPCTLGDAVAPTGLPERTRPITGQVLPIPCGPEAYDVLDVIALEDDDPNLSDILEVYRGCIVRITVELIEGTTR